jgi:hypothetical protein
MKQCPIPGVFGFESFMERTLEYMPMSVRMKLDLCGLKCSLVQWCGLPMAVRQAVVDAPCETPHEVLKLRRHLEFTVAAHELGQLASIQCDPQTWSARSRVPSPLASEIHALGLPRPGRAAWAALSDLQRFALIKLTSEGCSRNLRPALEEFGLCQPRPRSTLQELPDTGRATGLQVARPVDRSDPAQDEANGCEVQVFAFLAQALAARSQAEAGRATDAGGWAGTAREA